MHVNDIAVVFTVWDMGWGFCFEEKEKGQVWTGEGAGVGVESVCWCCICVVERQIIHAFLPQIASPMNGFE